MAREDSESEPRSTKGWIYIASNPSFPNLSKIGFTLKFPELRIKEFNAAGVPHNYKLEYYVHVANPHVWERTIHQKIKDYSGGLHEGKEWFRLTPERAIELVRRIVNNAYYDEAPLRPPGWSWPPRGHPKPNDGPESGSAPEPSNDEPSAKPEPPTAEPVSEDGNSSKPIATIVIDCFGCKKRLRIPAERVGTIVCRNCGYRNRVSSTLDPSRVF